MGGSHAAAVAVGILAGCLASALAAQTELEITEILLPEAAWLDDLAVLILAVAIISLAHVLIYSLTDRRALRLAAALTAAAVLPATLLLGGTLFATTVLLSAALGMLIAHAGEYRGIRGLWSFLGKVRGPGALVIFVLVALVACSDPRPFQESLKQSLVAFAASHAAPGANVESLIDRMLPDTVSEKELQHLRNALRAKYVDFDALPPDVQRQLEENMIQSYLLIKRQIKAALREALGRVDPETLREQLEEYIQSMPVFRNIMEYAGVLYALTASFIYTLLSWPASIVAFLLGMLVWRPAGGKVDKKLAE